MAVVVKQKCLRCL